jgi:hypothetical protein
MKKVKLFEEFVNEEMVLKDLEGKFGIKLDVFNTPNYIELTRIEIPKELIIAFADAQDKPIFLTPSKDFGASSIPRLEKFYKGLGFVKNTDKSLTRNTMVKYPTNEKN